MMGVVNLHHQISDCELQLMNPEPRRLIARRKLQVRSEIEKDVGGLRDDILPCFQEWRRERRTQPTLVFKNLDHRRLAALTASDINVIGACLFKRQPHELAAALNGRPIIKEIAHGSPLAEREVSRYSADGHVRIAAQVPVQNPLDVRPRQVPAPRVAVNRPYATA